MTLTKSVMLKTTCLLCCRRGIVLTTYILFLYFNPWVLIFFSCMAVCKSVNPYATHIVLFSYSGILGLTTAFVSPLLWNLANTVLSAGLGVFNNIGSIPSNACGASGDIFIYMVFHVYDSKVTRGKGGSHVALYWISFYSEERLSVNCEIPE